MRLKNIINNFNKHFQNNFFTYVLSFVFICIGIILGIYSVKYMSQEDRQSIAQYIINITSQKGVAASQSSFKEIYIQCIKTNGVVLLLYWILGLAIVGIPLIYALNLFKGFSLGFTFGIFSLGIGSKNSLISILTVIPQNIIYVPCIIIASVLSVQFSCNLIKDKMHKPVGAINAISLSTYTLYFIFIFIFMNIGFLLESTLTPKLINIGLHL